MALAKKLAMFVLVCCVTQDQGAAAYTFNFSKGALGCSRLCLPKRVVTSSAVFLQVAALKLQVLGCSIVCQPALAAELASGLLYAYLLVQAAVTKLVSMHLLSTTMLMALSQPSMHLICWVPWMPVVYL